MLFNSLTYFIFLGLVLILYYRLSHRAQNRMLLVASYIFYGWWDWRFLSLMMISTVVDYFTGLGIYSSANPRKKKLFLTISVICNLGLLGFFKYFNFFSGNLSLLMNQLGIGFLSSRLNIILPVGISFYTFQTMSYTIDIYRGELKPTRKFLDFALFVSFFPQLVAGPIERAQRLLPQILNPRVPSKGMTSDGLFLIALGLYKKMVIADNLAPLVDRIFTFTPDPSGPLVILSVLAFAFQIYCDFSGYSDIARGTAKLLGFDLMLNFNIPYVARNASDFWRRWHISLSTWLKDYLYIPLGGNRVSKGRNYFNLMATMLLGGLWHGAAWNFVMWGAYQGILLIGYKVFEEKTVAGKIPFKKSRWTDVFNIGLMFVLVCIGWLIFRANSVAQVFDFLGAILTRFYFSDMVFYYLRTITFFIAPLLILQGIQLKTKDLMLHSVRKNWFFSLNFYLFLIISIFALGKFNSQSFIYFQF